MTAWFMTAARSSVSSIPARSSSRLVFARPSPYELSADERAAAESFAFPSDPPFPDSRWRMIDRVDALVMTVVRTAWGSSQGTTRVDPTAWFFQAHFLDDPVWPGSLGLESLLQLLENLRGEALGCWSVDRV